jgi:type VI secretion system protein VasJ
MRYEPEFEQLQDEIAKLESIHGEFVNWDAVVEIGGGILGDKSKDILVACYFCRGLYECDGYSGLAQGLSILRDLVKNFWDTLYPELKRLRARVSALGWLTEKLSKRVSEHKPKPTEQEAVESCKSLVEQLEGLLKEKLGERADGIVWGELYRPLRDYAADLAREEAKKAQAKKEAHSVPKSAHATPAAKTATVAPSQVAPPPREFSTQQDVEKSLRTCQDILRKAAAFKREKSLADPLAYRLLRMATWMDLELPPVQNNMSQIRQIPAERLDFLQQQVEAGNHMSLINEVESSFAKAPFWLDAHRLTAMALESLGHLEAQKAVIADLAALLRRLPRLIDYQFMGGQPFADDLTRLWIDNNVIGGAQTKGGTTGNTANTADMPWLEASKEATQLATKGKFREGMAILQAGRRQAASRRERFLWDLHQARFCQEAGYIEIAMHQLESLNDEAEHYQLEEWEPDFSLEIAIALLACYKKLEGKNTLSVERINRQERMQSKISRLDATRALDLIAKAT